MSKYYWDDETIIDRRKEIEERIKNGDTTFTAQQWDEILNDLDEIIDAFRYATEEFIDLKSARQKNENFLSEYRSALCLIKDFYYDMANMDTRSRKLKRIVFSREEIINFMTETYRDLGGEYYEAFTSLLSKFTKNHRFFSWEEGFSKDGTMSPVRHLQEAYTTSIISATIIDIMTPVHEVGHGVEFIINPVGFMEKPNIVASEIIPTFFEFLAGDKAQEKGMLEEVKKYNVFSLIDALDSAKEAFLITEATEIASSLNDKANRRIYQLVGKQLHLGFPVARKLLTCNEIEADYKYAFAYMVAVELYMVYRMSPRDALNILRGLIEHNDLPMDDYLELLYRYDIVPGTRRSEYKLLLK